MRRVFIGRWAPRTPIQKGALRAADARRRRQSTPSAAAGDISSALGRRIRNEGASAKPIQRPGGSANLRAPGERSQRAGRGNDERRKLTKAEGGPDAGECVPVTVVRPQ